MNNDIEFIEDLAEMELNKLTPTIGGAPASEKAKQVFLREIRSRKWELGRGRNVTPLDDNNGVLTDDHGWQISFADAIKNIASELFDLGEQKSNAVMTEEDYISSMKGAQTREERAQLTSKWLEQKRSKK